MTNSKLHCNTCKQHNQLTHRTRCTVITGRTKLRCDTLHSSTGELCQDVESKSGMQLQMRSNRHDHPLRSLVGKFHMQKRLLAGPACRGCFLAFVELLPTSGLCVDPGLHWLCCVFHNDFWRLFDKNSCARTNWRPGMLCYSNGPLCIVCISSRPGIPSIDGKHSRVPFWVDDQPFSLPNPDTHKELVGQRSGSGFENLLTHRNLESLDIASDHRLQLLSSPLC